MSKKTNRNLPGGFTPLASSTTSGSRLRLDLDSTKISSSDSSGRNISNSKNLDYAYNDYLQAILKKHIISKSIRNYEVLLQQQINYQQVEIDKMKKEYSRRKTALGVIIEKNEIVNILQGLEDQFKEFEKSIGYQNVEQLISLSNILGAACRQLKLVDVKQFSNQEEWFLLVKVMHECSKFLQIFFQSHRFVKEFELINEISLKFRETSELEKSIQEQIAVSSTLSKKSSVKYLEKIKNLFDMYIHSEFLILLVI